MISYAENRKEQTTMQRLNQQLWGLFHELVKAITALFDEVDHITI